MSAPSQSPEGRITSSLMRTASSASTARTAVFQPAEIPRDRLAAMIARVLTPEINQSATPGTDGLLLSHALVGMVEQAGSYCERRGVPPEVLVDTIIRLLLGGFVPGARA